MKTEHKCSNCFKVKPISEFYPKKDKHQGRCKTCNAEVCAAYRKKKQNREMAFKWARLRGEI